DDLPARAEIEPDPAAAFDTEWSAGLQRDPGVLQDPLGGAIAPAELTQIDPRQVSGIGHPIPRSRQRVRETIRKVPAVRVERDQQAVEPLVALLGEGRRRC